MLALYNYNLRSSGRRTGFDNTITKHFRDFIGYELFICFWIMPRFHSAAYLAGNAQRALSELRNLRCQLAETDGNK